MEFSAAASGSWHRWFPFFESRARCANLKAAFLVAVVSISLVLLSPPANESTRLSDSTPLLDNSTQKPDLSNSNRNSAENVYELELVSNSKHVQNEVFSDGAGAVLVNLLTNSRHLPPSSYCIALSWVSLKV
ncbi:hypothetical protein V6N12_056613 [Hibiscus sabdariffa]|uniref:Uncharacterized protein n=1 Tax=Hibiscus sabdariffa TaxID=183260 RepID=A0ABR2CT15_9ROSI